MSNQRNPIAIRVGLPYSSDGELAATAAELGAPTLISAGSLRRTSESKSGSKEWRWTPIGLAAWKTAAALDSAGFVAMMQGGYRWDVSSYVEFVVTNSGDGSRPFPWSWWSAMDYCVEPEIASNREEVVRRVDLTVESYRETLEELDYWRGEGVTDVPDPLPILQGRRPEDYLACAAALNEVLVERGRSGLPALVGLGSVCRRDLHGEDGLLAILEVLFAELPTGVRLHLFGVKGAVLPHLVERFPGLVASIDSMAWDFRARKEARAVRAKNTVEHRSEWLRRWYETQVRKVSEVAREESVLEVVLEVGPEKGIAPAQRNELRAVLPRPVVYRDPSHPLGIVSYNPPPPLENQVRLSVKRASRAQAQALVRAYHRHLPKPPPGEKAAFVVYSPDGVARGAAMIGRPSSRVLAKSGKVLEVTRVAADGTPNACSALLGACCQWAQKNGFERVLTYTLEPEGGAFFRGAGFVVDGTTAGGTWDRPGRERDERSDLLEAPKVRWIRDLRRRARRGRSSPNEQRTAPSSTTSSRWIVVASIPLEDS